ncbi:VRR-NUC domain-containing protein [Burkholderia gladioli]|uniref:VRR-NUC domain-containing protein n=1 Tax=Burkholderia gladioli TaxID=28095 RepID=UPI0016420BD6|nr:VRR-NUC domain-containing protein [Burkholderia gladioli]
MSDYGPGGAAGGMSPDGETTPVGAKVRLSKKDRAILCRVLCRCKQIGVATRGGRILRQRCVQQRLDLLNEVSRMEIGTPTEYKPEQTYNMKVKPPEPVTDPDDPLRPHADIRQWINDFWPGGRAKYRAGKGYLRRPDVVIVDDPAQPPVQSNIKKVVEFKFPPDSYGKNQRRDYIRIAGSRSKLVTLGPAECGCASDDDQDGEKSIQKQSKTSTTDLDDLAGQSGQGGSSTPGGGLPPPNPGGLAPGAALP